MRVFQKSVGILFLAFLFGKATTVWAAMYTPPVTSGLVIQYDGSNYNATTGIWTNSGSYTGTNVSNQPNANAIAPVTKPTASTINGQPAVHLAAANASDPSYRLTGSYLSSNPLTTQAIIFITYKIDTNTAQYVLFSSGGAGSFTDFGGTDYEGVFRSTRLNGVNTGMPNTSNTGPFIEEVDSSNSLYNVLINGASKYSTSSTTFAAPGTFIIGVNSSNGAPLNGDISQILIYNTTLTTDQRNAIGSSLASFYGVSGSSYLAPEPASLGLLGFGGLLLLRRRRGA